MELESGNMFGLMAIKVDDNHSSNMASWTLFDSLEHDDFEGFEENFPAGGFSVVSVETPQNLTLSDLGNFEWEGDELLFECKATWKIEISSENFEAWGAEYEKIWGDSTIVLEHSGHPGLAFLGMFPTAPEYS